MRLFTGGFTPIAATVLFGIVAATHAAELTMGDADRQAISGWGIFPGYAHSNWGAPFKSIADRPAVRDKVFELPVNYIRLELCPNCYDPKGPDGLDSAALDEMKTQILTARDQGAPNWIVSVWSPPAAFKTPVQNTKGRAEGKPTYLNMDCKEAFCAYYASALAYLRDHGCGTPVMISLQNEPNYVVDYDGCSYASAADYRSVLVEMRHALDAKKLQSVRLGGSESAHPGDPVFFGVGTSFWQDVDSVPLDDALTHTYGGAGWDHFQFSRAPRPKWMTEWCDIDKDDETHAAVKTAAHIARDLVNDGFEKWIFWNAYDSTTQTGGSANLVYGSAADPKTTKTFHVLKQLFKEITPDGSFKVRAFKSNDPAFETGLGKDFSKPVNVIGFKSPKKTVVMIANTNDSPAGVVLKGLSTAKLRRFESSATTPSEAEMDDKGTIAVTDGAAAEFSLPAQSVEILSDGEIGAE